MGNPYRFSTGKVRECEIACLTLSDKIQLLFFDAMALVMDLDAEDEFNGEEVHLPRSVFTPK